MACLNTAATASGRPAWWPTRDVTRLQPTWRSVRWWKPASSTARPGLSATPNRGVSGAGRKPSLKTHFCEVTENFSAYSILQHRHVPEVLLTSGLEESEFSFTAQLLPLDRGILETIYFRAPGLASADDLLAIYEKRYAGEPFIRLYNPGSMPDLHAVARTNFCDIGVTYDATTGRAVVVSAIDNLVKGAAGQAVQNMNLMLGFPESEGLQ